MLNKIVKIVSATMLLCASPATSISVMAEEKNDLTSVNIEPRVSYTRPTSKTVNGCVITASIIYDGTTGKINRATVTKSNNNVNIQYQYWLTNNDYTCVFDVDIYLPGQSSSPVGWNPTLNSPGPMR